MEKVEKYLNYVKNSITKSDIDWVWLNCGSEGSGKSTFGLRICRYVQNDFPIENITFSADEFINRVKTCPPYSAVLVDEGGDVFMSREAMSKQRIGVLKEFMKIRRKNLFIVINISDPSLMERYISKFRARTLTQIISHPKVQTGEILKGIVLLYSRKRMKKIHKDENGNMRYPKPNFPDRFSPLKDELWDNYNDKKDRYLDILESMRKQKQKEHNIIKYFKGSNDVLKSLIIQRARKDYSSYSYIYSLIRDAIANAIIVEQKRHKLLYLHRLH